MPKQYKVDQLMVSVAGGPDDRAPGPFPNPTLPDCWGPTGIGCHGGLSVCPGWSMCPGVSLPCQGISLACNVSLIGGTSCLEACISCTGCSLVPSCGLTNRSHPAICSLANLEGLEILQQQLTDMLTQLEERTGLIDQGARPHTPEEASELEARLASAMEQVRTWRGEMEQTKPGPEGQPGPSSPTE